jgi:hypothetical protein
MCYPCPWTDLLPFSQDHTKGPANIALQLTSGMLVVARVGARHLFLGSLAAERGR